MQRQPRQHDSTYLDFIRSLPCIVCGDNTATEAAHVRMSDARVCKFNAGVGAKPDDCWTLPLCGHDHRTQHEIGEKNFWREVRIDPIFYCMALARVAGDRDTAERIIMSARPVNILAAG